MLNPHYETDKEKIDRPFGTWGPTAEDDLLIFGSIRRSHPRRHPKLSESDR